MSRVWRQGRSCGPSRLTSVRVLSRTRSRGGALQRDALSILSRKRMGVRLQGGATALAEADALDNWLTIVLGVAAGSILAGWIHRMLNGPWRGGRGRTGRSASGPSPVPAEQPAVVPAHRPGRATDISDQIERDKAALKKEARNAALSDIALFMALLFAPMALIVPFVTGSFSAGLQVFVWCGLLTLICWYCYRTGTRDIRRLKRRINDLERALEVELGLRPGAEGPGRST